jgi:hypothetical protein
LDAIEGIVAALPDPSSTKLSEVSLAGGSAGLAVLCAYLALTGYDDGGNAEQFLEQAVQALSSTHMAPSLYGGFAGVAWTAIHVQKRLFEAYQTDSTQGIDDALRTYLARSPWHDHYDLIAGLVGLGVYALEQLPHSRAAELLGCVVDRLDELAEHNEQGIAWFTPPQLLPDWQRELCPKGYYNLGVAHGMPGVIALLGQACAAGVRRDKAEPLLEGAVAWLLTQKLRGSGHSIFPSWAGPGIERDDCRLAWCYGDAGIAAALLGAARCLGKPVWEQEALEVARQAAQRTTDAAGVADAGLCHGAAGLGHIFNRIYQASGAVVFKEAAIAWFERTLEMRRPTGGIGGFCALDSVNGERCWVDDPGLLGGAAGIALALLAAITSVEPAWDRVLLVSIPNGPSG